MGEVNDFPERQPSQSAFAVLCSSQWLQLFGPCQECGACILGWVSFGGFRLGECQPISSHGIVISALLPCDGAGLVFCPFRQGDGWRERGLGRPRAEDDKVIVREFHAVEGCFVVFDDLPNVEPEFLERGVATSLFLQLGQPDMPLFLVAAVLPGDLINAPLKRTAQAKIAL